MKKRYQIDQQRAVQEFRQLAREEHPNLQMVFPLTEVVGLLQEGVGHLMRGAGLALMSLVMEEEVRHLAGERHEQHPARRAHRWGKEAGYCVVDGQKVPIQRTRLRSPENREQRLGSYEMFQRSGPMEHAVWDKLMRGLSTRNYGAVVKDFREAYGVEKSAVSEKLITIAVSHVESRASPLNWFKCWKAANSASSTASSASASFPGNVSRHRAVTAISLRMIHPLVCSPLVLQSGSRNDWSEWTRNLRQPVKP
jgi:hypothetical protein